MSDTPRESISIRHSAAGSPYVHMCLCACGLRETRKAFEKLEPDPKEKQVLSLTHFAVTNSLQHLLVSAIDEIVGNIQI